MGDCVCERDRVKERKETDAGLHIETFLAAGDKRGGRGGSDRDREREGLKEK